MRCHQEPGEKSRLNCPRESRRGLRRASARCALDRPGMVMNGPRLAGRLAVVAPYHATDFFHYGKLGPNATSTRRSRLHRIHWRRKVDCGSVKRWKICSMLPRYSIRNIHEVRRPRRKQVRRTTRASIESKLAFLRASVYG